MEGPGPTGVEVGVAPLAMLLLTFASGALIVGVCLLCRKRMERPLYLSLLVFGIAVMVGSVGLSFFPLVDVVTVYSSGSGEDSGE